MNDNYIDYMLIPDVVNSGRKSYMLSILSTYMLSFIGIYGFNGHFLSYVATFILGSFLAIQAQNVNYYFNDLILGVTYRILLITILYYLVINLSFLEINLDGFNNISLPSEWRFFYFTTPLVLILYFLIGTLLSFPFKVLSYLLGYIPGVFYLKNRKVVYEQDETLNNSKYNNFNESELEALRTEAIKREDFEEARRITDYLENKFPD